MESSVGCHIVGHSELRLAARRRFALQGGCGPRRRRPEAAQLLRTPQPGQNSSPRVGRWPRLGKEGWC